MPNYTSGAHVGIKNITTKDPETNQYPVQSEELLRINTGVVPRDGTGDVLSVAAEKQNTNVNRLAVLLNVLSENDFHLAELLNDTDTSVEELTELIGEKAPLHNPVFTGVVSTTTNPPENSDDLSLVSSSWVRDLINQRILTLQGAKTLYVDCNLHPTSGLPIGDDSLTNSGTSPQKPFASIERGLQELAKLSIVEGPDKFDKYVLYLAPGDYYVDNRPGGNNGFNVTSLTGSGDVRGGLIVPRGASIVGADARKVRIIPHRDTLNSAFKTSDQSFPVGIFKLSGNSFVRDVTFTDNLNSSGMTGGVNALNHNNIWAVSFATNAELEAFYNHTRSVYNIPALADPLSEESNIVTNIALNPSGDVVGASPYIFNCAVRSKYGMNGMLVDGKLVGGLKSMLAAQFTQISLQTLDTEVAGFKLNPTGLNYKTDMVGSVGFMTRNDAYAQVVSCFCICNEVHYAADTGGEMSITNSCSDFGVNALYASGYRRRRLDQDADFLWKGVLCPRQLNTNTNPSSPNPDRRSIGLTSYVSYLLDNSSNKQYISSSTRVYISGDPDSLATANAPYVIKNGDFIYIRGTDNNFYAAQVVLSGNIFTWDGGVNRWYINVIGGTNQIRPATLAVEQLDSQDNLLHSRNLFFQRIVDTRPQKDRIYRLLVQAASNNRPPQLSYIFARRTIVSNANLLYGVSTPKPYYIADVEKASSDPANTDYYVTLLPGLSDGSGNNADLRNVYPNPINYNATEPAEITSLNDPLNSQTKLVLQEIISSAVLTNTDQQLLPLLTPKASNQRLITIKSTETIREASLLRPSIIRASSHTWEWVGYPANIGTNYKALPNAVTATGISEDNRRSGLKLERNAGRVYSSGMDETGRFYIGDRQIELSTGQEVNLNTPLVFDLPGVANSMVLPAVTITESINVPGSITVSGQFILNSSATFMNGEPGYPAVPESFLASTTRYGLARTATQQEIVGNVNTVNAYVTPAGLQAWATANNIAPLPTTPDQEVIAGTKTTHIVYLASVDGAWNDDAFLADPEHGHVVTYTEFEANNTNPSTPLWQVSNPNSPGFRVFRELTDAAQWANKNVHPEQRVRLNLKPGLYSLIGATFNCAVELIGPLVSEVDDPNPNMTRRFYRTYEYSTTLVPTRSAVLYSAFLPVNQQGIGTTLELVGKLEINSPGESTINRVVFMGPEAARQNPGTQWSWVYGNTTVNLKQLSESVSIDTLRIRAEPQFLEPTGEYDRFNHRGAMIKVNGGALTVISAVFGPKGCAASNTNIQAPSQFIDSGERPTEGYIDLENSVELTINSCLLRGNDRYSINLTTAQAVYAYGFAPAFIGLGKGTHVVNLTGPTVNLENGIMLADAGGKLNYFNYHGRNEANFNGEPPLEPTVADVVLDANVTTSGNATSLALLRGSVVANLNTDYSFRGPMISAFFLFKNGQAQLDFAEGGMFRTGGSGNLRVYNAGGGGFRGAFGYLDADCAIKPKGSYVLNHSGTCLVCSNRPNANPVSIKLLRETDSPVINNVSTLWKQAGFNSHPDPDLSGVYSVLGIDNLASLVSPNKSEKSTLLHIAALNIEPTLYVNGLTVGALSYNFGGTGVITADGASTELVEVNKAVAFANATKTTPNYLGVINSIPDYCYLI